MVPIGVATVGTVWVNSSPGKSTAPRAFRAPCPSTIGFPTGPGSAVPSSCAFTSSGVKVLPLPLPLFCAAPWMRRAAAPLVTPALNEVPDPTKFAEPTRAEANDVSMVEPGARRLTTERPDVTRSGLNHPSTFVGPTLLNDVGSPAKGFVDAPSSSEPTVIARGSSPGERIVPLAGPAFPADATTAIPACHAVSTAWSNGLVTVDDVGTAPREMFRTRMPYWSRWATTQLIPAITVARSVIPLLPATLTETRLAPGASPL